MSRSGRSSGASIDSPESLVDGSVPTDKRTWREEKQVEEAESKCHAWMIWDTKMCGCDEVRQGTKYVQEE